MPVNAPDDWVKMFTCMCWVNHRERRVVLYEWMHQWPGGIMTFTDPDPDSLTKQHSEYEVRFGGKAE